MVNAEQVVIDIIANDKASSFLNNIRNKLTEINNLSSKQSEIFSSVNQKVADVNQKVPNVSLDELNQRNKLNNSFNSSKDNKSKSEDKSKESDNDKSSNDNSSNRIYQRVSNTLTRIQQRVSSSHTRIYQRVSNTLTRIQQRVTDALNRIRQNTSNNRSSQRISASLTRIYQRISSTLTRIQQRVSSSLTRIYQRVSTTLTNIQRRISTVLGNVQRNAQSNSQATPYSSILNTINQNVSRIASRIRGERGESSSNRNGGSSSSSSSINGEGLEDVNKGLEVSRSNFHELNTLMESASSRFEQFSSQIAGIFGASGLGELLGKMWEGAAQRQTNMLYLIHQKGVDEANSYYNEIMDIVTQLPGDDTFLTNILNLASALDDSVAIDNLKEMGQAITDYYIASTMKGELPFEVEKDIRKYISNGEIRPMRNSILASEVDLLKDKNNVLERTEALQKALENAGFDGMSQYESATNELEELRGHFQKAFADLGTILISIGQPLMNFYNALDSIFGGRISQGIILVGLALVTFFTVMGGGLMIFAAFSRNLEIVGMELEAYTYILQTSTGTNMFFHEVLRNMIGIQALEAIAIDGSVKAGIRELVTKSKLLIVKELNARATATETVSLWGLITATYSLIKSKVLHIASTIREMIVGVSADRLRRMEILQRKIARNVTLTQAEALEIENTKLIITINTKLKEIVTRIRSIGTRIYEIVVNKQYHLIQTEGIVGNFLELLSKLGLINVTYAEITVVGADGVAKQINTVATLELAGATGILTAELTLLGLPILVIIGVIIGLVIAIEKVGEAFGWWKDFGSMISAIGEGINRLWNAFIGSEVIQGIIIYFQKFVTSIQYVWQSISNLFGKIFGWDNNDNGTFDIVQSIIGIFGQLGEVVKWVWNLFDDWSNSPLGIITWLNPLGVLIFHLDEIGSLFEDISDAIDRFMGTLEFQELMDAFGEVWNELQAPFQEIWSLINEIIGLFGEIFGSGEDPVGRGTEGRINFLVELLKGLATIIRVVVIPAIRGVALVIRVILTPIRVILTVIRAVMGVIQNASQGLDVFSGVWERLTSPLMIVHNLFMDVYTAIMQVINGIFGLGEAVGVLNPIIEVFKVLWEGLTSPLSIIQNMLQDVWNVITMLGNAIKNSVIGKIFGWDKDNNNDDNKPVDNSNPNIKGMLNNRNLTENNVNNVRNLGRTYNNTNNQKQVVINQHFSEGSMPIDARNMTKKEAKKMFIGAFGYNRSVGSKGILR